MHGFFTSFIQGLCAGEKWNKWAAGFVDQYGKGVFSLLIFYFWIGWSSTVLSLLSGFLFGHCASWSDSQASGATWQPGEQGQGHVLNFHLGVVLFSFIVLKVGLAALAVAKQLKSKVEVRTLCQTIFTPAVCSAWNLYLLAIKLEYSQVEGLGLPRSLWSEVSRLIGGIACENISNTNQWRLWQIACENILKNNQWRLWVGVACENISKAGWRKLWGYNFIFWADLLFQTAVQSTLCFHGNISICLSVL